MGGTPIPAPSARHTRRPAIRVLVAEDVAAVRDTVVALLGLEPDIEVVTAVASGDQIVPAALRYRPDVTLLDIGLPGTDGLTAAGQLAGALPGGRVLVLARPGITANPDAAVRAGVSGFLLKDGPADDLISAVRAVARGERVIDP